MNKDDFIDYVLLAIGLLGIVAIFAVTLYALAH